MTDEQYGMIQAIRWVPQHGRPREKLGELLLVQEALQKWGQIRHVVAWALVHARVVADYDEGFRISNWWMSVHFPDGEEGRSIMIGFDGGQELGGIAVSFSDWHLADINVDHTDDWFCPLSEAHGPIRLLTLVKVLF